ncbi:hypothetical protein F5X99DRAFT_418065 [Biscogniauxia marginata]|nr:hypothetical protein F5X99DRAFT_418065 [Biscogniauxia marginata]
MSPPPRPFQYPSAHSGFGFSDEGPDFPDENESDDNTDAASLSTGNYSPPAWRRLENGDRWYGSWRGSKDLLGRMLDKSRHASPHYHINHMMSPDDIFEEARRTRLPTGSLSPEKCTPEPESPTTEGDTIVKMKSESASASPLKARADLEATQDQRKSMMASISPDLTRDNYIRFAVRADIQQRTESIDAALNFVRSKFQIVTKSWGNLIIATLVALLSISAMRSLFQPMYLRPVPDLVKVAGIARSFEPLIYYSENGFSQVGDLQATGVAVWDLSESVRLSNMTSAPTIVKALDELSDSLKTLAMELTKFFANVDGDIDAILIVMEWAKRELNQLQAVPSPPLSTAFSNIHNLLCVTGVLEDPSTGSPTRLGTVTTTVFGMSHPQRTRYTLQRTFNEFLSVLEEAIETELQHSLALFGLFEAIDRQFLNLARMVVRESSAQDEEHAELLSSMWTRILGPKASQVKKYERNRELLLNVREKTVRNKGILVEHNGRLMSLKASLEALRRKLVSPLVRSVNSSTISLEEQIEGLSLAGSHLQLVRTQQKTKIMDMLYGPGASATVGGPGGNGGGSQAGITAGARLVEEGKMR